MGNNRCAFIAVVVFFLLNAAICWGVMVPPGHDGDAVFEKRVDTVVVFVVVEAANRPDMCLVFVGVCCTDGLNWYVYCENNPLKFVDKTGLFSIAIPFPGVVPMPFWICPGYIYPAPAVDALEGLNAPDYSIDSNDNNTIDWSNPPSDPNGLGPDWEDKTPDKMRENTDKREFKNKKIGEIIRWEPGKKGEHGWRGKNHWHRYNPQSTGKKDFYLDKYGNPVAKNSPESHIDANPSIGIFDSIINFFQDLFTPESQQESELPPMS